MVAGDMAGLASAGMRAMPKEVVGSEMKTRREPEAREKATGASKGVGREEGEPSQPVKMDWHDMTSLQDVRFDASSGLHCHCCALEDWSSILKHQPGSSTAIGLAFASHSS